MKIKQALILAAGEGQRMRPLTIDMPKPLVKVNGRSMLDRILSWLEQLPEIKKIVVNGFYLAEVLEKYLDALADPRIIFSKETIKLETGGGFLYALPHFDQNEPILIINGDIVWQEPAVLDFILQNFDETNTDILLGLKAKADFLGYSGSGDFNLKNGKVSKDLINDFVYTGIQIFHPRILQNLNLPMPPFSLNYFFKDNEQIRLRGIELPGKFFHISTPQDLYQYQNQVDFK